MITLVHGMLTIEDLRCVKYINLVAKNLSHMLRIDGDRIKLHSLNRALYDLSFKPTNKEFRSKVKWSGIHTELI